MFNSMWTCSTGMASNADKLDATAHNISNINTKGFRRHEMSFSDLAYAQIREQNPQSNYQPVALDGPEVEVTEFARGHGTRSRPVRIDESTGTYQNTDLPTDMAIRGEGYFTVGDGRGEVYYSRLGAFQVDADGHLVHPSGLFLLDDEGDPVEIPPDAADDVSVDASGQMSVTVMYEDADDGYESVELADLVLAMPSEGVNLEALGDGLYDMVDSDEISVEPDLVSPQEEGAGTLAQGVVEGSNVDLASEMMELILAQRAFQLNGRTLQTADEMLDRVTNIRR